MTVRTLLVAFAVCVLTGSMAAEARNARPDAGVTFAVTFKGEISGTWRHTQAKGTRCGSPGESSGTFSSTLGAGTRAWTLLLSRGLGSIDPKWSSDKTYGSHPTKMTFTRTGEGYTTKGDCYPYKDALVPIPRPTADCGTKTFVGPVSFQKAYSSKPTSWERTNRMYLHWVMQPRRPDHTGYDCPTGRFEDMDKKGNYLEQLAVPFSYPKLLRCGQRQPRGCRLTIGKTKTFSVREVSTDYNYPERSGENVKTESIRVSWSMTFVAVGRG